MACFLALRKHALVNFGAQVYTQLCANKWAPGVALAGAGITRRGRSSWQRVAVAVAPARAPVLAVVKAAAVEAEGRAQVTQAAGQARPVSRPAATGRTCHRRQVSNASCNGTCNGCNALQVAVPNRSGTLSIPIKAHCKPLRWALYSGAAAQGVHCGNPAGFYPDATGMRPGAHPLYSR